jgi:F-type H+-transporting ATPase subunit epsilon
MAKPFRLEVITPVGKVLDEDVTHFRAPGAGGDFGVLADHAPLMAGLRAGRLQVDTENKRQEFAIAGGYAEVHNNRAVILAETCVRREEIDLNIARRDAADAQRALDAAQTQAERSVARVDLDDAMARIYTAEYRG